MLSFSLDTTPALEAKMRVLEQLAGSGAMDAAILAGAQLIVNAAQGRAPVLTGTLRRSIRAEVLEPGVVGVGSEVPYARRIEYGFAGTDKLGRTYNQAAQPFLRPAFDETKERVQNEIARAAIVIMKRVLG